MAKQQPTAADVLTAYRTLTPGEQQAFAEALAVEPGLPAPLCHLWVSPAYAAELLRKSRSTVKNDIQAGRLKTNGMVGRGKQLVRIDTVIRLLGTREPHVTLKKVPAFLDTPASLNSVDRRVAPAEPRVAPADHSPVPAKTSDPRAEPTPQELADFQGRQECHAKKMEEDGRYYGAEWARGWDNADAVSRLTHWADRDGWNIGITAEAVAEVINDGASSDDVWRAILDTSFVRAPIENNHFLTGFVEGALDVYEKM